MRESVTLNLGFTLLELLITIVIAAILLMISIPNFHAFIVRNRINLISHRIMQAIQLTRSAAIEHDEIMTYCGSSDHKHCDGEWRLGQIIITSGGKILREYSGLKEKYQLTWHSNFHENDYLKMSPSGFTDGQRGSFYLSSGDRTQPYGVIIVVTSSGRTRLKTRTTI